MEHRIGVVAEDGGMRVGKCTVPEVTPDSVLIAVSACGICGSDLHFLADRLFPPGSVLGHEFSGTIVAAGQAVRDLSVGTRVVVNPIGNGIGIGKAPGAFADFVRVDKAVAGDNVFPLPPEVDDIDAAMIEPLCVGLHAVNLADPKPGAKVVVMGAGMVGLCTVLALRARGFTDVVVTAHRPVRCDMARKLGVKAVFNPKDGDVGAFLRAQYGVVQPPWGTPTSGAEVIFDCAGTSHSFLTSLEQVAFGGKVVVVANYGEEVAFNPSVFPYREINLIGSFAYSTEFPEAIDLIKTGAVNLRQLITHRFELGALAEAINTQTHADDAIKVMVTMNARAAT